jgi:hypothetical protein
MKNKISSVILATVFALVLSASGFAQKTVAHIYKDAPVIQDEKTATFQVVLDNIDNDQEKDQFTSTLKGCKQIHAISASAISANKVTYTITMDKENIFFSFQRALTLSNIENTEFYGKSITTTDFGQVAQAEYNKAVSEKRNPK